MKKHKLFSKCISIVLTVCLMVSMVTVGVSATNVDDSNNVTSGVSDNMEVQGTNSLGTMLASEIEAKSAETKENNGCNIFEITVEGKQATATFETTMDSSLIVGIYDDKADNKLIASGTVDVTSEDTEVAVDIDIEEMPQYFYLKGFLVDKESLKPICTAYNSPNYTQEMQEFFSKTTEDFEEDRILNLDSSIDNNFAVYKDDVKIIEDSEYNKVVSADAETSTYIIENIDESISTLQVGDIFTYDYDLENVLIVKIASITIEGTTATIIGEETDLDEVFDYVKLDTTKSDETIDYTVMVLKPYQQQ